MPKVTTINVPGVKGTLLKRDVVVYNRKVDFRDQLVRGNIKGGGLNFFNPLLVGDFIVSIQASATHHSSPRANFPNARNFTAFEVMIFHKDSKGFNLPRQNPLFSDFESGGGPAGWVNAEDMTEILNFILDNPEALEPLPALPPAPESKLTEETGEMVSLTADEIKEALAEYVRNKFGRELSSITLTYGQATFGQDTFGAGVELD